MATGNDALYSAAARGRWRLAPEAVMRAALARQTSDVQMFAYCEVCLAMVGTTRQVVADPHVPLGKRSVSSYWYATLDGTEWQWNGPLDQRSDAIERLGTHEHNEDLEPGVVRFYVEHPTGGFKTCVVGGWGDVVERLPFQAFGLCDPPTYRQINEVLAAGGLNLGMGGGIECPVHQLSEHEWSTILREMFAVGRFIKERPPANLDPDERQLWEDPYLAAYRANQRDR